MQIIYNYYYILRKTYIVLYITDIVKFEGAKLRVYDQ